MKNFLTLLLFCMAVLPASASLIGDDIDARWQFVPGGFDFSETFTVGPGIEGNPWVNTLLDISASAISIDYDGAGFTGQGVGSIFTFSDLDWVGTPGHIVDVLVSTNWIGFDDSFITFGTDWIEIDFLDDVSFDGGTDFFVMEIVASHNNPIPEPMTLSLLGMGIAGLAVRRRFSA